MKRKIKDKIKKIPGIHYIYIKLCEHNERKADQEKIIKNSSLQRNGDKTIAVLETLLEPLKIDYFYDFGSLLGIVREGHFLSHDLDIDISCNVESLDDFFNVAITIDKALKNNGFSKKHDIYLGDKLAVITYDYLGVSIDFFANVPYDDKRICYEFYRIADVNYNHKNEVSVWGTVRTNVFETKLVRFEGANVRIPLNAEKVLEDEYTQDWKTPNPNWEESDCPNLLYFEKLRGRYDYKKY